MTLTLAQRVESANQQLEKWRQEGFAVSNPEPGTGYVGFKAQYVIDAANMHLGAENWYIEDTTDDELREYNRKNSQGTYYGAAVKLYINVSFDPINPVWVCKGTAYGSGGSDARDPMDGRKASQSDAIKKAFALISLGNAAYRGLLADVQRQEVQSSRTRQPRREMPTPPPTTATEATQIQSSPPVVEQAPAPVVEQAPPPVMETTEPPVQTHTTTRQAEPAPLIDVDAVKQIKEVMLQVKYDTPEQTPYFETPTIVSKFLEGCGFATGTKLSQLPASVDIEGKTLTIFEYICRCLYQLADQSSLKVPMIVVDTFLKRYEAPQITALKKDIKAAANPLATDTMPWDN